MQRLEQDHLAAQPDSKWPLLTVARLKEAQVSHVMRGQGPASSVVPAPVAVDCGLPFHAITLQARLGLVQQASEVLHEVHNIYARLMELDPLRRGYYQDALEGKAFVVVQALGAV